MLEKKKKIIINEEENVDEVNIKKSGRSELLEEHPRKVNSHIDEFYNNERFSSMDKPQSKGLGWAGVLLIAIIFGLIAGFISTIFIFQHQKIELPFGIKIDVEKLLSNQEQKVIEGKNITITSENYLTDLITELQSKMVRIFPAKMVSDQNSLSFLDQIYAPWQTLGLGAIFSSDGWIATTINLNEENDYIILDESNKIFLVDQIVLDSISGINFLKVNGQGLSALALPKVHEIFPGEDALIFDKFRNLHLTNISDPTSTIIYKTEDLIQSTDEFSDYLRLNKETSILSFPNGLLFTSKGSLLGLISNDKIIPAWHLPNCLNYLSKKEEIKRLYLGIDYIKIGEAPGLLNNYFKDLAYGVIVYGPPSSGSPAEKAGIKNADIIIKADDNILGPEQNLTYLVQGKLPGDQISLVVMRQGKEMEFNVILEEKKKDEE